SVEYDLIALAEHIRLEHHQPNGLVVGVDAAHAQEPGKTMLHLEIHGRSARREGSGDLLAVDEERMRAGGAADRVEVRNGRAKGRTVGRVIGNGPNRIMAEGVNVQRQVIIEQSVTGAKDRGLSSERTPG